MKLRRVLVVVGALVSGIAAPLACSPQVVDAVDSVAERGGSSMTGGSGGGGGTAGSAGGEGATGGGIACPDGGSDQDLDGDGTIDCLDECPEDALKTVPGTCGCGLLNPTDITDGGASCSDLIALLAHRYTFIGPAESVAVVDSQAGMQGNGEVVHTRLSGDGTLVLTGGRNDQYAGLPNGLLNANPSITLEAWVRWNGGNPWQRIFDFGDNDAPTEGLQGPSGTSYLFLTPRTRVDPVAPQLLQTGKLRLAYKNAPGELELIAEAPIAFPSGGEEPTHVAVVVDSENKKMTIYVGGLPQNGAAFVAGMPDPVIEPIIVNAAGPYDWGTPLDALDGGTPPPIDLSQVLDHNNWLGRSQFVADDGFGGTFYEFRIYAGALTAEQIAISHKAGPDPVFFPIRSRLGNDPLTHVELALQPPQGDDP